MKASTKRKIHTAILKAVTYVMFALNMTAICCMDSTGWVFWAVLAVYIITGAYLLLFAWANDWLCIDGQARAGRWFK